MSPYFRFSRKGGLFAMGGLGLLVAAPAWSLAGQVLSPGGAPVANALVRLVSNPTVFAKSDESGNFEIDAPAATVVEVAAFGYETTRLPLAASLALPVDPLLATDVYHVGFDHMRPGSSYDEEDLKKDLPVSYGIGFGKATDPANDRASVDPFESVTGKGSSLKVRFPAGALKTSGSGVDTRIPLRGTINDNPFLADELYLSYWMKPSDNFQFDRCGGKLPSLGGSDVNARTNQWKGRIMWRRGGSIQFYMELPHAADNIAHDSLRFWGEKFFDGGSICENKLTPYLKPGQWNNIELHYKLNTPGKDDGFFEGWVNGVEGHKLVNASVFGNYRPAGGAQDNLTINAILLSAFLGGSSAEYEPSEDIHAWFDEIRVSKTRIDEYRKYQTTAGLPASRRAAVLPRAIFLQPGGVARLEAASNWSLHGLDGAFVSRGSGRKVEAPSGARGILVVRIAPAAPGDRIAHRMPQCPDPATVDASDSLLHPEVTLPSMDGCQ